MLFKTATSRNIFSIVAVGMVATVATASSLFVMSYQQMKAASSAEMTAAGRASAVAIESGIASRMQLVYTMRDTLQAMSDGRRGDRATADRMLMQIQSATPGILGVWTGFEPDAFDGRDSYYIDAPNHDGTGRYIPMPPPPAMAASISSPWSTMRSRAPATTTCRPEMPASPLSWSHSPMT